MDLAQHATLGLYKTNYAEHALRITLGLFDTKSLLSALRWVCSICRSCSAHYAGFVHYPEFAQRITLGLFTMQILLSALRWVCLLREFCSAHYCESCFVHSLKRVCPHVKAAVEEMNAEEGTP